ncbi:ester cyclase [Nocardia sp. NPDC003482]
MPSPRFALAQALAEAKSRQDIPAALTLLHPEFTLHTPPFGTTTHGRAATEKTLASFFTTFPDYEVTLDSHADNGHTLVCWGTARMTMSTTRFGVTPNGRRAELPVFIRFTFADDLIAEEVFFFDLSTLCAQSGVSTNAVRHKLFGEPALV